MARRESRALDTDEIVSLGALLGAQYVRRFSWHWSEVNLEDDHDEDNYHVCVLPAGNHLSINPIVWIASILNTGYANNILLNFNMVAEGKVPRAAPGEALGFR